MATLSLCMIVKNEEDTLKRCLSSVSDIVDEIIIVDTGSSDKTIEIAKQFTGKIFSFEWIDDFAAARNFSYAQATKDYIMWLDADDVILPEDQIKLKELMASLNPDIDVLMLKYNVGFDSAGNVTVSNYRERISKRSRHFQWHEPVHEHLDKAGLIISSDIAISHKKIHPTSSGRNIRIYDKYVADGKQLTARGQYYYARELEYNHRFDESITWFTAFLDSGFGWIEDNIAACHELANCYIAVHDSKNALKSMFRSFEYAPPRAELCCQIGYYFKNQSDYTNALFWFELALSLKKPENSWGFINTDFWGYIPCIELAVCYDKLGNIKEAIRYNNMAAEFKPDNPSVLYNKKYFESLQQAQGASE